MGVARQFGAPTVVSRQTTHNGSIIKSVQSSYRVEKRSSVVLTAAIVVCVTCLRRRGLWCLLLPGLGSRLCPLEIVVQVQQLDVCDRNSASFALYSLSPSF